MAVFNIAGTQLASIYGKDGTDLSHGYDKDGGLVFPDRVPLTSFEMFYPNDATDDYAVANYADFNMTTDQFLALKYDGYVSNPPAGITVTKRSLGKDSTGQFDIWEYDFNPENAQRTILLLSGEHAYEITAQFGLAHLIEHIYRIQDNDAFTYIRKYVRVKVIPIMNPWGANQFPRAYGVYDGINPERNFNYMGLWEIFSSSHDGGTAGDTWNKKGDYPFQTAETRTLAKWQMDNQDADFIINCHTGEDSNNRDVWIDYMVQTAAADAVLEAVQKNQTEFTSKFSRTPRTEITGTFYPSETGYGMHGSWAMFCVNMTGLTLEQSPKNTIFGDGKNAGAGAIDNYASVLSTNIFEMLLEDYQPIYDRIHPSDKTPITAAVGQNVSLGSSDYSATVALSITPNNTTQFTFDWVSSNPAVCEVWGCTDQAVIVKRGTGTATVTATNRLNPAIQASFTVTVD